MRRSWITAALLLLAWGSAEAADYPSRPIAVLVPYGAGGPTDTVGRIVAEAMSQEIGGRLVVENVAGAGGTIGTGRVAAAEPDGYTLLFNHIGMATAQGFYPTIAFDPVHDFEPIGQVADVPMALIGRSSLPAHSLAELIAYVKKEGAKVTIAHAGPGTASYLCALLLEKAAGIKPTQVSYNRGFAPATIDLLAGRIDLICDQTSTTTKVIADGSVRAFGVTTKERLGFLPDVPTMDEGGLKGFELAIWHGFYAPKNTPRPIRQKLTAALQKALGHPMLTERYGQIGAVPVREDAATPASLAEKLAAEVARWTPVIKAAQAR